MADFGLSKEKRQSYVSGVRDLRGTLPFIAPELVNDPDRVTEKADVWSMGMLMWELLTLASPFQDMSPQAIISGLMVSLNHSYSLGPGCQTRGPSLLAPISAKGAAYPGPWHVPAGPVLCRVAWSKQF